MGVFKRKNKGGEEGETWYVDYYDPTGKRIIKAIGPKKREAEDYLGKVKAAIRENRFFDIKKVESRSISSWMPILRRLRNRGSTRITSAT